MMPGKDSLYIRGQNKYESKIDEIEWRVQRNTE